MRKRLKNFVQQCRTDINSYKSENLITPADCIKYNQSECVQGTLSELRLNGFIFFSEMIVEMRFFFIFLYFFFLKFKDMKLNTLLQICVAQDFH